MNLIIFHFFFSLFLIFPPPNLALPYPKRGGLPFPLFGFRQQPIRFGNGFGTLNWNPPINSRQFQHSNGGYFRNPFFGLNSNGQRAGIWGQYGRPQYSSPFFHPFSNRHYQIG